MVATDDSDEEPTTKTTKMPEVSESKDSSKKGVKRAKKSPSEKPPLQPFFTMNEDGSLKSYIHTPEILMQSAALTLHEMDRKVDHEKMLAAHAQLVRDKMRLEGKDEKEIDEFLESCKTSDPAFAAYEPNILIDPDVPRDVLEQIASDKTVLHASLGNAIECANGNTENRPFACDSISEVGAKKRARKQNIPIACLAYEGNKQKVTGGAVDQVFGIASKAAVEAETARKKNKTLPEMVTDLDKETRKSGFDQKVKRYTREMGRDLSELFRSKINDKDYSLEDMTTEFWKEDRELFSRPSSKSTKKDVDESAAKIKLEKEREKMDTHVKKICAFIRKEVVKKHCEINEASIKKTAVLMLSKEMGGQRGKKSIDEKKLEKTMDETRKEAKTKLLDKKDPKLETLAKELLIQKVRKDNLKKSKIVCPTSLDLYTPLTNKSPCGRVNMTPQHAKLIQKKKGKVMDKYAKHASMMRKKGLCIKIWA